MTGVATLHPDLRAGVRARLLTLDGLPTSIAWEGRQYWPQPRDPFMEELFRPIASEHRTVGPGGTVQHTATAVLTLRYPQNSGTVDIERVAGTLLEAFGPGSRIVHGGAAAIVQRAERAPLIHETDWISCAVTITLLAWTVTP